MTPQPSAGRNGRPHSANDADGYSNTKLGGGSSRVEPRGKMDLSKKLTAPEFRASTPALPAFTAFLAGKPKPAQHAMLCYNCPLHICQRMPRLSRRRSCLIVIAFLQCEMHLQPCVNPSKAMCSASTRRYSL